MKVYVAQTKKGLLNALDDISKKTCDGGLLNRIAKAKVQRKAARRQAKFEILKEVIDFEIFKVEYGKSCF